MAKDGSSEQMVVDSGTNRTPRKAQGPKVKTATGLRLDTKFAREHVCIWPSEPTFSPYANCCSRAVRTAAAAAKILPGETEPAQDLGFYEQEAPTDPLNKTLFDEETSSGSKLQLDARPYGTVRCIVGM